MVNVWTLMLLGERHFSLEALNSFEGGYLAEIGQIEFPCIACQLLNGFHWSRMMIIVKILAQARNTRPCQHHLSIHIANNSDFFASLPGCNEISPGGNPFCAEPICVAWDG